MDGREVTADGNIIYTYSVEPTSPVYKDWSYSAVRCAEPLTGYSSESDVVQAMTDAYVPGPDCAPRSSYPHTDWGTGSDPVSGTCGSTVYYPKVDKTNFFENNHYLSATEINTRHYSIDYVVRRIHDDGTPYCVAATDGFTVSKKRRADCPEGYWVEAILPESSPYDTQIGTKCINNYTGKIFETISYSLVPGIIQDDKCSDKEGNPCNPLSGNKLQTEVDYESVRAGGLNFYRTYNSIQNFEGTAILKNGWKHNFQSEVLNTESNPLTINVDIKSSFYPTRKDACINGWMDIRSNSWSGRFVAAIAQFDSLSKKCNLLVENKIVSSINFKPVGDSYLSSEQRVITHPNGSYHLFRQDEFGNYISSDSSVSLIADSNGYIFYDSDGTQYHYAVDGKLIKIQSPKNRFYLLEYNLLTANGGDDNPNTLDKVTNHLGENIYFAYAGNGKLTKVTTADGDISYNNNSVTYPDGSSRQYLYESTNYPEGLTGIINENGIIFANWDYDVKGRALFSKHITDVERVNFSYNNNATTTVTDILGAQRTYFYKTSNGYFKTVEITGDQCRTCSNGFMKTRTYDDNGFLNGYTDWNNNKTTIINNTRGLPISQTDAVGTLQERTTITVWHAIFNLPLSITESKRKTIFTYTSTGQLLTHTVIDLATNESRTTSYTYHPAGTNGAGLIASVDGPRTDISDITHYDYDTSGNLISITNALGQTTQITSHDPSGRPLTIIDANNVTTTLTWDLRGRLLTINTAGSTTSFEYDPVGQLIKATQADGSYLAYTYDDAHRLTGIADNANNKINYVLDKMGNRTSTSLVDTAGNISYTQTALFDKLSRLQQSLGANSQQQSNTYDLNHNNLSSTDALTHQTQSNYDALDRLIKSIDPDAKETNFEYDAQDNLTKVTDAKGMETSYIYNGFDEAISKTSPDTGTTTYTYDKAGNLTSMTDARGVTINYSYDALNRLLAVDYPDNTLDVAHNYDSGANGIGRLTSTTDASGTTTYAYDERGNLLSQTLAQGVNTYTTSYTYNAASRLTGMTYPSGNALQYQRAANGEITQITATINGTTQTIMSNASYQPFGPLKSFTYGNALEYTASFDQSLRLTEQSTAGIQDNIYGYNTVDNLLTFDNALDGSFNQIFDYDANDRLITANGNYGSFGYVFDVVGNRTQKTGGADALDYTYGTHNHHLEAITGTSAINYQYDAVGNTTAFTNNTGTYQFIYGDDSRLHQVMQSGVEVAHYTYNALGQRVIKQTQNNHVNYHYNQYGQLIAETDAQGNTVREYGWFEGKPISLLIGHMQTPTGSVVQDVSVTHKWKTVSFTDTGATPVIIAGVPTFHGKQAGAIRIKALSNTQAKVAFKEWNYLDGKHKQEQVPLLNLQAGSYSMSDGSIWEVGTFSLNGTNQWKNQNFISDFPGVPKVFLTSQTSNGKDTVTVRAKQVTIKHFKAALFEQESKNTGGHKQEIIGYLAIYSPSANGTISLQGNDVFYTLESIPLKHKFKAVAGNSIKLQEEQSQDQERKHRFETVAVLTFNGHLFAQDNSSIGSDTVTIRRNNSSSVPQQLSTSREHVLYFIHNNYLGTPEVITDQSQSVVWHASYTPYGEANISTETISYDIRLPGQYFDAETGLYYNYFRYYDPSIGRYVTSDPIGLSGGINTYAYVGGNPTNFVDPLGLDSLQDDLDVLNAIEAENARQQALIIKLMTDKATGAEYLRQKGIGLFVGALFGARTSFSFSKPKSCSVNEPFVPAEYWQKYAPDNITPGIRRIDFIHESSRTGRLEESRVIYDEYGRQSHRIDKTDHMRPEAHSNPHLHERTYNPKPYDPIYNETLINLR